jgi:gliding motility-associated-like protein
MLKKIVFLGIFILISSALRGQVDPDRTFPEDRINECPLFIPNAFTPNGDNNNDKFGVKMNPNCHTVKFNMKIFDRWGRMLYDVDDFTEDYWWDGTYEGNMMKDGIYIYIIIAEFEKPDRSEREEYRRHGSIALIK